MEENSQGVAVTSESLPVGDFRFLSEEEISKFDTKFLNSIPSDSPIGYILECDLSYPPELHDLHADCHVCVGWSCCVWTPRRSGAAGVFFLARGQLARD